MGYEDGREQEDQQLLEAEQAADRRPWAPGAVESIGAMALNAESGFIAGSGEHVPPEASAAADDSPGMSRADFIRYGVVATVAAAEALSILGGITWFVRSRKDQGDKLQGVQNRFVTFLKNQKTAAQVEANIPNRGKVIDLAAIRRTLGVDRLDFDILNASTSYTYLLGVKNDAGGMDNQPNAVSSIAVAGMSPEARARIHAGRFVVMACAEPGAYSGVAFPGDRPYGLNSRQQVHSPDVIQFIREGGAVKVARIESGLDDLRLLIATSPALVSTLRDVVRFLTSDSLANEAEHTLDGLKDQVINIGRDFGQHLDEAYATLAGVSRLRIDRGEPGLFVEPVICWDLYNQPNMPANITTGELTPEALQYLTPDPMGPNRYFLRADSIPYGRDIAHWIWVVMMEEQNAAEQRAIDAYGSMLAFVPINLTHANEQPTFYEYIMDTGELVNNGHFGPNGAVAVARADLEVLVDHDGNGRITAASVADIPIPKPPSR